MLIAGVRGTAQQLGDQFISDAKGFLAFGTVILVLGAVGAVPELRGIAKTFLVLVFVVFLLANKGQKANAIIANLRQNTLDQATIANNTMGGQNFGVIGNNW